MPGSALVWCFPDGLGVDRVTRMVVATHLPVRGDGGGVLFPGAAGNGVGGHRAKSVHHPGGAGLSDVLAEAPGAVVHHGGDLGQVGLAFWVGQAGYPSGPRALRLGEERVDARPNPGVQDGGNIPCAGEILAVMAEPRTSAGSKPASSAARRVRNSRRWRS